MDAILQMPKERLAVDLHVLVEGKAEILRERALARSVEARAPRRRPRGPPPASIAACIFSRQLFELVLDAVGDDVLARSPLFSRSSCEA